MSPGAATIWVSVFCVTLFFLTTFLVIASESDDLFRRLLLTSLPSSHVVLSSVLSKFNHKKLGRVSPLDGVTRGGPSLPSPSDATAVKQSGESKCLFVRRSVIHCEVP